MEIVKITPEIEKIICDKIINNISPKIIIKEYNISYQKIRDILFRNNIKIKLYTNIKVTPKIEVEICNLYKGGLTCNEIGDKFNIVPSTVYKALLKNNIEIRNSCLNVSEEQKQRRLIKSKRDELYKDRGWHSLNPVIGNGRRIIRGFQRHHVNLNDIIYIPTNYNQEIPHNLMNGFNMEIVNTIAYFFLIMNNIEELNKSFNKF